MKRVLILIPRMGGGGAERVVSIMANKLSEKYLIQITTLVSNESFYPLSNRVNFTSALYKINRLNKMTRIISMGVNFISSIFFTRKTIKEYQPDIVFSLLEEMDIVTYLATRNLSSIKWICSERNDPTKRNVKLQRILELIYQKSDMLICQSSKVADYYSMVKRKVIIPNPVDFNNYPEVIEESNPPRIVSVGRLVAQKNMGLLIKAFSLIADKYPDITLTIYGDGPERKKLEDLIANKKLQKRILLPGARRDILNTIKDAAIFAFPTNYEGFPNVLIEAIAMGIPVISTDFATGIAKEIVDENVGVLVKCGDIGGFSNAIEKLLINETQRQHIRKFSRKAIEAFDIENVMAIWDKLFKELLEGEHNVTKY